MSEFYIGYQPKAPRRLGGWVRRVVFALNAAAIVIAILLALGQLPFAESRFEFLEYREYVGTLQEQPYPTLLTQESGLLLVAPGKHGADPLVRGLEHRSVRLQGSLIQRGADRMLELLPGSVHTTGAATVVSEERSLGAVKLTGEIVDSKCYLGVMNPGNGKVHRDCAVRCISGGIPPALAVRDRQGVVQLVMLIAADGSKIHRQVLDRVAEPVEVAGDLFRIHGRLAIRTDPRAIRRQPPRE